MRKLSNNSVRMVEYQELRKEILSALDKRNRNFQIVFTVAIAVSGFGIEYEKWWVFLAANIFTSSLWLDEVFGLRQVFRNATYIEKYIEPHFLGSLQWEKHCSEHIVSKSIFERLIPNFSYPLIFLLNSILGVYFISMKFNIIILNLVWISLLCLIFLATLCYFCLNVYLYGREHAMEAWKKVDNKLES